MITYLLGSGATCENCLFFQASNTMGGNPSKTVGVCRKLPPRPMDCMNTLTVAFPKVLTSDWCGSWSPNYAIQEEVQKELERRQAEEAQKVGEKIAEAIKDSKAFRGEAN